MAGSRSAKLNPLNIAVCPTKILGDTVHPNLGVTSSLPDFFIGQSSKFAYRNPTRNQSQVLSATVIP